MTEIIIDEQTKKLLDEMGFVPSTKSPKLYEIEIKDGFAYVDFRKVDGRRFAMVKGKPVDDEDSIPILKAFKERRGEIKKSVGLYHCKYCNQGFGLFRDKEEHEKTHESQSSSAEVKDSSQRQSLGTPDTKGQDKQPIPPSDMVSNPLKKSSEPAPVGGKPILQSPNTQTTSTGVKTAAPPTPIKEQQPTPPAASQSPIFDYLKGFVGNDLLELFGDTGTGKSKFVHTLALEAIAAGKTVYFLDTERNLSIADVDALGTNYHYTPILKEIRDIVLTKLPKVDLVIIDSVGLPILTRFATYTMKERGNALLDLIAIVGRLKEWAYENDALAVITNQPESEFGKAEGEIRKPFGDKACFAAKEIWRTLKLKTGLANSTTCSIESFRSRSMKSGLSIMKIEISDSGTKISMGEK